MQMRRGIDTTNQFLPFVSRPSLWAETSSGCILGGSSLGKKGKPAEQDGENAANEILESIKRKACVDSHAQDQVCRYLE